MKLNNPYKWTAKDRAEYVTEVETGEEVFSCCHGHINCATYPHGPCVNEVMICMEEKGESE
jgi:hypothetical protein